MKFRFGKNGFRDKSGKFHPYATAAAKAVKPRPYLYFAYGSNLNQRQFQDRCPHAKLVGTMALTDWKLVFRGVADIVPAEGSEVFGALYTITNWCEEALDRYEGFPDLYGKRFIALPDGRRIMFYVMNSERLAAPSQFYFGTIWQGYQDVGLDPKHLIGVLDEQGIKVIRSYPEPILPLPLPERRSGHYGASEHWRYGWNRYADEVGDD